MIKLTHKTIPPEIDNHLRYEDSIGNADNINRSSGSPNDGNQSDEEVETHQYGSSGFKRENNKYMKAEYRDNRENQCNLENINIQENLHIDTHEIPRKPKNFSTFNPEMSSNSQNDYDQDYIDESEVRLRSDRQSEYNYEEENNYTLKKSKLPTEDKKAPLNGTGFSRSQANDESIDNINTRKGFNYTDFSSKEADYANKDNKYNYTGFSDRQINSYDYNDPASDVKYQSRGSLALSDNKSNSNNKIRPSMVDDRSNYDELSSNSNNKNRPSMVEERSNYDELSSNSNEIKSGTFNDPEEKKQYIDSPDIYHKKRDERTDRTETRDIVYKNIPTNQNNVSNINVNNSNINDMIKRDLQEYLSNLESQNVIKVSPKAKNRWVLEFKDNSNRDGTGHGWNTYKPNNESEVKEKSSTQKSKDKSSSLRSTKE
jgi:hypothetical protein